MSADPPQAVNTGVFAGYQNFYFRNAQFIEVLYSSIFHPDLVNNEDSDQLS